MLNYTINDFFVEAQRTLENFSKEDLRTRIEEVRNKYTDSSNDPKPLTPYAFLEGENSELIALDIKRNNPNINERLQALVNLGLDLAELSVAHNLLKDIPIKPHNGSALIIDMSGSMQDNGKNEVSTMEEVAAVKPIRYRNGTINSIASNLVVGTELTMRGETIKLQFNPTDIFTFNNEAYNWGIFRKNPIPNFSTHIKEALNLAAALGYENLITISDGEDDYFRTGESIVNWFDGNRIYKDNNVKEVLDPLINQGVRISPIFLSPGNTENEEFYAFCNTIGTDLQKLVEVIKEDRFYKVMAQGIDKIYSVYQVTALLTGGIASFGEKGKKGIVNIEEQAKEMDNLATKLLAFIAIALQRKNTKLTSKFNLTSFLNGRK